VARLLTAVAVGAAAAATVVAGFGGTAGTAYAAGAPGIPGGMVSTDFQVSGGPSGGLDDITYFTTVVAEPTRTTDHYFWADQFSFAGGQVGYIGLQPRPNAGAAPQGAAYFSVFGEGVSTTDPHCASGADGGTGLTCHVPFAYQLGHVYVLNVTRTGTDTWTGTVDDQTGGALTPIATWTTPAAWGLLSPHSSAFTEYYAKLPGGCDDIPYALVVNGTPVAEHGTLPAVLSNTRLYGGTGGGYVNCGTPQYAHVWRDAAGSYSETGLPHLRAAGLPAKNVPTSGAGPGAATASASNSAAAAGGPDPGGPTSGAAGATSAPAAQAPTDDGPGGNDGNVLPALGMGAFAAALVGLYFWWSKRQVLARSREG
jgi:hypothetical protein